MSSTWEDNSSCIKDWSGAHNDDDDDDDDDVVAVSMYAAANDNVAPDATLANTLLSSF